MRQNTFYAIGLCLMLFVSSCIYDNNLNECFYGLRLNFVSTLYDAEGEPNYKPDIRSVKVFVFDASSVLCATTSGEGDCLASDYKLDVALPPGIYKVMVWGSSYNDFERSYLKRSVNAENHTELFPVEIGKTILSDFILALKCYTDEESPDRWLPAVADFDDLYFGMVGKRASGTSIYSIEDVTIPEYSIVEKQVDLMRNTNRLKVSIKGAQNLKVDKENVEVYVQGYNGCYYSDNSRNEKIGVVKYAAENFLGTDQIWDLEIKTQRIRFNTYADKPLMLYLFNKESKQIIYKLNVIEILLEVQDDKGNYLYKNQEAFDQKYVHFIELNVKREGDNVVISIFVNGWEIKNIYPVGRLY